MTICELVPILTALTGLPTTDGDVRIEVSYKSQGDDESPSYAYARVHSIQILEDGTIVLQGEQE
jgi:hypothetical protein